MGTGAIEEEERISSEDVMEGLEGEPAVPEPIVVPTQEELDAAFLGALSMGFGAFLPGWGPGEPHWEERWVLWCYRYEYEAQGLAWIRVRTGFPERLAEKALEVVRERWPTLPDAYERPKGSGRDVNKELGVAWPVYRAARVSGPDPVDVPGVATMDSGGGVL